MTQKNEQNGNDPKPRSRLWIVLLILLVGWFIYKMWQGNLLQEGTTAPLWRLPIADESSKMLGLEELRGKVVVLDFWSTTCPPCLSQMKELEVISRQTQTRDVVIVGIATGGESKREIAAFKKRNNVAYPLLVDAQGEIATAYQVIALPTLYILDRQGNVANAKRGFWDRESLLYAIGQALEIKKE